MARARVKTVVSHGGRTKRFLALAFGPDELAPVIGAWGTNPRLRLYWSGLSGKEKAEGYTHSAMLTKKDTGAEFSLSSPQEFGLVVGPAGWLRYCPIEFAEVKIECFGESGARLLMKAPKNWSLKMHKMRLRAGLVYKTKRSQYYKDNQLVKSSVIEGALRLRVQPASVEALLDTWGVNEARVRAELCEVTEDDKKRGVLRVRIVRTPDGVLLGKRYDRRTQQTALVADFPFDKALEALPPIGTVRQANEMPLCPRRLLAFDEHGLILEFDRVAESMVRRADLTPTVDVGIKVGDEDGLRRGGVINKLPNTVVGQDSPPSILGKTTGEQRVVALQKTARELNGMIDEFRRLGIRLRVEQPEDGRTITITTKIV